MPTGAGRSYDVRLGISRAQYGQAGERWQGLSLRAEILIDPVPAAISCLWDMSVLGQEAKMVRLMRTYGGSRQTDVQCAAL